MNIDFGLVDIGCQCMQVVRQVLVGITVSNVQLWIE